MNLLCFPLYHTTLCDLSPPDRERWLLKIQANGNLPEDWLLFTDLMRSSVRFKDDTLGFSFLTGLYAKAIKVREVQVYGHRNYYGFLMMVCSELCKVIFFQKSELTTEVGRWVQVSLGK